MKFRFDSNFEGEPERSSEGRSRLPVDATAEEWGRDAMRAGLRESFEPQVRRVVRRVLSRRTPDESRLARRVREEVRRVLRSMPEAAAEPKRLEDLVTARLCRSLVGRQLPPRRTQEALTETVRY